MHHATVPAGLVLGDRGFLLQHRDAHSAARRQQVACQRQPDDAAADNADLTD